MCREYIRHIGIWLCLMVLLALTCASAFFDLGPWNSVVNFAVAAAKAVLVALFFMHLLHGSMVLRVVSAIALFTLALLFALSSPDYATRIMYRAPWQVPPAQQAAD